MLAGVSKSRYISISILIKYSNFSRFYKKLGPFYKKNSDVISLVIDQSQPGVFYLQKMMNFMKPGFFLPSKNDEFHENAHFFIKKYLFL